MNIQEIDFQPLFQWINNQLGINVKFTINFEGKRPKIVCPDLYNQSGIFMSVIKEVEVDFFNFNFNAETGNLWATVYLGYKSWSGGSNGMQIGSCCFNPETGWTFESERQYNYTFNGKKYDLSYEWQSIQYPEITGIPKIHPGGYLQVKTELFHESVFFEKFKLLS